MAKRARVKPRPYSHGGRANPPPTRPVYDDPSPAELRRRRQRAQARAYLQGDREFGDFVRNAWHKVF